MVIIEVTAVIDRRKTIHSSYIKSLEKKMIEGNGALLFGAVGFLVSFALAFVI